MNTTAQAHSRPGAAAPDVRHPIFARLYARVLSELMEREIGDHRRELLAGLNGRVLEVGAGNGMNFPHYPATVEEVVALEPEPYLRAHAVAAATEAAVKVNVRPGVADPLPFGDDSFDAAVVSIVLCTVPDQAAALAELRRVLVPGATLRFMEHLRSDHPLKARLQRGVDRSGVWTALAGGCHCARDTVAAITAAGFEIEQHQTFDLGPSCGLHNPHVRGSARAPASSRKELTKMEMTLEVIVVPVADVERAKQFYAGKLGFNVDTDAQISDDFRVVQLTPPGSGCSIVLMTQGAQMEPGTLKGLQLVVQDLRSAREELAARGLEVSEVQVIEGGPPRPAEPDEQLDYRGFVFFEDPDGNGWAIQQLSQPLAARTAALAAAEGPHGAPEFS
jgi:SAM-dependent methyltransferase